LPLYWKISDWSLLEQKVQQVFEKWGPETPIRIESDNKQYLCTCETIANSICINQIKCDLVNLPVALSREITMALCNIIKKQQQKNRENK
jgi:hypothetical protein